MIGLLRCGWHAGPWSRFIISMFGIGCLCGVVSVSANVLYLKGLMSDMLWGNITLGVLYSLLLIIALVCIAGYFAKKAGEFQL